MIIRSIALATVLFLSSLVSASPLKSDPIVNWSRLSRAFQEYVKNPSPEKAEDAIKLLPISGHVKYTGSNAEQEAIETIYSKFQVLERQIKARQKESVRLAFRLMSISDGTMSEDLDIMLGKLIRMDPRLFLQELQRQDTSEDAIEGLLANLGEDLVDDQKKDCAELKKRNKALQSVKDQTLLVTRDRCLSVLKRILSKDC